MDDFSSSRECSSVEDANGGQLRNVEIFGAVDQAVLVKERQMESVQYERRKE